MNAPCGYLSFHPDGTIIKINRTLCNWLQYAEFDIFTKKTLPICCPKAASFITKWFYMPCLKCRALPSEINFDIRRANHTVFPALGECHGCKRRTRKYTGNQCYDLSILPTVRNTKSELLNAKKEADNEKKRFELLADLTPDIIFTATPEGIIEYANQRFYEYFNLTNLKISINGWC